MRERKQKSGGQQDLSVNLGFDAKLQLTADNLDNNIGVTKYEHVVLGLIFLKYTSDSFDEHHAKLLVGNHCASTSLKAPWSFIHAIFTLPNKPKILEAFHRICSPLHELAEANRPQSHPRATLLSGELSTAKITCPETV